MREGWKRRRLARRTAALCLVLVLLCGSLLPAFAEGAEAEESLPGQVQKEDEPAAEEEPVEEISEKEPEETAADPEGPEMPEEPEKPDTSEEDTPAASPEEREEVTEDEPGAAEEPLTPDSRTEDELPAPEDCTAEPEHYAETTYLFWLSEKDETEGGLPYAEQTVGSGQELLMPEEPEAEGKTFRYWYSRDEEGEALRFTPPEGPLSPEADGEQSLYAYFTTDALQEEPADPALEDIIVLPAPDEETDAADTGKEELAEGKAPAEDVLIEDVTLEETQQEDALPVEEADTEEIALLAENGQQSAAVFLLKSPTCLPGSNDPSQWAPDDSECRWIGQVNTWGAVWNDRGRNITENVSNYVVSWPDGSTGAVWTLNPGDHYWDDVVDEIWDEYKASIEEDTGITGLEQSDLESLTVTPYKISRNNGTWPDQHIDCTISVKSKKSFTARFNVRVPGAEDYTIVDSHEYQTGDRVEETEASVEKEITIGGVVYVFDGWYREKSGPVTDEPGDEKVTQGQWDAGYLPEQDELENGVVNFYAHYVLSDMEPDTGVTLDFAGVPLLLGAIAAGAGCKMRKKEEDE